jgi:hypothetical protein
MQQPELLDYRHASSADQSAVLQNFASADRAHAQAEPVFPDVFFLFRLIDALGHGAKYTEFTE